MRTNYVLIDFESVQPETLAQLAHDHFKLLVFVGATQKKVPFEFAASLQQLGARAEYVKISGSGPNTLDFHIAYYIGQLAAQDESAYFHIVSNDSGFDPLIQHLKSKKVFAGRVKDIADIPFVNASSSKSPVERIEVVLDKLRQMKVAKPRTVKTLSSTIGSLFQKRLADEEVAALVQELVRRGYLTVSGTKITYAEPNEG